jgi:protein-export membrane protein SecD/preprotein translocase SecF subunit
MKSLRWRIIFVSFLTLLSLWVIAPTVIYMRQPAELRNDQEYMKKKIPSWLPHKYINLGLDLQGGVQLVLGVKLDQAVENRLARLGTEATRWGQDKNLGIKEAYPIKGQMRLHVVLEPKADAQKFREEFKKEFPTLEPIAQTDGGIEFKFRDDQIKAIKSSAIEQAERVIRNRIDKWGVTEPLINRRQDNTILVQLPGFKDPEKAREFLGRTAQLKFKIVDDEFAGFDPLVDKLPPTITTTRHGGGVMLVSEDKQAILDLVKDLVPADREVLFQQEVLGAGNKTRYTSYVVKAATELTGEDVLDANIGMDTSGLDQSPIVQMRFTGTGGKRFEEITGANIKKRMAIILDDVIESAPVIQSKIAGGHAQITLGSGRGYEKQIEEANQLSLVLKSGALPASIDILEQRQVGASLGPELAYQGILGTAIGVLLVFIFMIGYYHKPGLIACAALVLNGLFVVACMAIFGFALTLPGIAGFVLGLGIAVDANVLINERIRQELREGKAARKALDLGFKRVFWTVFDSHVTTILAAVILLETNTSGPIRGFAVTLIIGLIVSLFTALYCSHLFFDIILSRSATPKAGLDWLGGERVLKHKPTNFNFFRLDLTATTVSFLFAAIVIAIGIGKGFNWSVDFVGGLEIESHFKTDTPPAEIRTVLKDAGFGEVSMQALSGGKKQYLLRFDRDVVDHIKVPHAETAVAQAATETPATEQTSDTPATATMGDKVQFLQKTIHERLSKYGAQVVRVDYVGPQIGRELRNQGFLSLLFAILGIMVYLGLRFDMRFGSGAVMKLIPDTCAMLAFYLFFWRSFDLTAIAALLTGIGYSVNDVIVVFDRIRENLGKHPGRTFRENINTSLNETLSRTINTSIVTNLSLVGLLIFGTGHIWNFAMAMSVGIIGATLTSNLVGSTYLLWFDKLINKPASKA